jgi:hypothetical protein
MFYSNCLIEALKAKIRHPFKVKITFIPKSEKGSCHFMWSDGEADYDFGVERDIKWYEVLWFKGEIRKRSLGFNKKYKETMMRIYARTGLPKNDTKSGDY